MVCPRCKASVHNLLVKAGYEVLTVELGEATISQDLTDEQLSKVENKLRILGFELITDRRIELIEKVKTLIIDSVYWRDDQPEILVNYSEYLSSRLHREYHYLSNLFAEIEGISIKQYLIRQRIERAKELITYGELNFQAIAQRLHYRNIHHFSNQFKRITGMSPTAFKLLKNRKRENINDLGGKIK